MISVSPLYFQACSPTCSLLPDRQARKMSREQKFDISADDLEIKALLWRRNGIKYGLVPVSIPFMDLTLQHFDNTVMASVERSHKTAKVIGPLWQMTMTNICNKYWWPPGLWKILHLTLTELFLYRLLEVAAIVIYVSKYFLKTMKHSVSLPPPKKKKKGGVLLRKLNVWVF